MHKLLLKKVNNYIATRHTDSISSSNQKSSVFTSFYYAKPTQTLTLIINPTETIYVWDKFLALNQTWAYFNTTFYPKLYSI